jgi:hypothetical protein
MSQKNKEIKQASSQYDKFDLIGSHTNHGIHTDYGPSMFALRFIGFDCSNGMGDNNLGKNN